MEPTAQAPHLMTRDDFDPAELKRQVESRLADLVPAQGRAAQAARYSLLAPAKRLRAIMTMLAARQSGGSEAAALDAACAVEMVHSASLIFDDLPAMDDARLRRGVAATHVAHGEDMAILAGIGLMNGAFGVIARDAGLDPATRTALTEILSAAIGWSGLVNGQALDLGTLQGEGQPQASLLDEMHDCKTGALFSAAVLAGAETAGADQAHRGLLCQYARSIGLAYQAFDDVLDQVADEVASGKSTARDAGKLTQVSLNGLDRARIIAEGHISEAITFAERHAAQCSRRELRDETAPLADLALFISRKFDEKFALSAAE